MKKLIAILFVAIGISGLVLVKGLWQREKGDFSFEQNDDSPFDFYVLSLSWSPTFCLSHADKGGEQCNGDYGFIVHGLWPQYESGYPRACPSNNIAPDEKLIDEMMDIMPSRRLVKIQWDRHGTCSGLKAQEYYKTLRNAYEKVRIPHLDRNENVRQLEKEFTKLNPGMREQGIAVIKSKKHLSEVRICMTKELKFRDCIEVDAKAAGPNTNLNVPDPK